MKKYSLIAAFCVLASTAFSQSNGQTSLVYNMAIPLGKTADYIDQASFRGAMVKGDYFLEDEFSLGFAIGFQTFYQEMGTLTETRGTLTATGSQFRYINTIPMLAVAKYHPNRYATYSPYVGLGVGTYYFNQTVKFAGIDLTDENWKFALQPEVGLGIRLSPGTDILLAATYNTAFKNKDMVAQSYLGFQVGFCFKP